MTTLRTDKKENRAEEKTVASHRIGFKPSLGRRLGMGNCRWWRWFIAPPNARATAPDKRLVRFFSGIAACPLTATLSQKCVGIRLSGRIRIAAAIFFFIAGRIALIVGSRVPWLSR